MEVLKLTLTVSGDHFLALEAIKNISGNLDIVSKIAIEDFDFAEDAYGLITFMHSTKFSIAGQGSQYEEDFVNFIEENYEMLTNFGASDFDIFTEFYHSDYQCNFEILNRNLISRIARIALSGINIALPVSTYKMNDSEIQELITLI